LLSSILLALLALLSQQEFLPMLLAPVCVRASTVSKLIDFGVFGEECSRKRGAVGVGGCSTTQNSGCLLPATALIFSRLRKVEKGSPWFYQSFP
jgi:hypothetical protein